MPANDDNFLIDPLDGIFEYGVPPLQDLRGIAYVVDSTAPGGGDGLTPETAWNSLSDINVPSGSLVAIMSGSVFDEVYTYTAGGTEGNFTVYGGAYIDTVNNNSLVWYNEGSGTGRGALPIHTNTLVGLSGTATINSSYIELRYLQVEFPAESLAEEIWNIEIVADNTILRGCLSTNHGSKQGAVNARTGNSKTGRGVVRYNNAGNALMVDCDFRFAVNQHVKIIGSKQNYVFYGNTIGYGFSDGFGIDAIHGGALRYVLGQNNVIEGGASADAIQTNRSFDYPKLGEPGHNPTQDAENTDNKGHWWVNNHLLNAGGYSNQSGFDMKGSDQVYILGNVVHGVSGDNGGEVTDTADRGIGGGIYKSDGGYDSYPSNALIRHNIVYDNKAGGQIANGWSWIQNTVVNNDRDYNGPNSTDDSGEHYIGLYNPNSSYSLASPGTYVFGNISQYHLQGDAGGRAFNNGYWDYNMYGVGARYRKTSTVQYANSLADWRTFMQTWGTATGLEVNSFEGDAQFTNVPSTINGAYESFDFTTGVNTQDVLPYTTKTFGAGSGTVVTTEAALSFQPGVAFSAPHLSSYSYPGDYIKISNNPITQVLSVDPANNQITIADAQGWLSGASIHLTDGTNILNDLGACQNGALPQVPVQPVGGLV